MMKPQMMMRFVLGLCLALGFWLPTTFAQNSSMARLKRRILKRKARCLLRCHNYGMSGFRRCYRSRRMYCAYMRGHKMKLCLTRCKFPGFCQGFRRTASTCLTRCWKGALKKRPKKYWNRRLRRWIKPKASVLRRYLKREQFACKHLCKSLNSLCLNVVSPGSPWKNKPRPRDY